MQQEKSTFCACFHAWLGAAERLNLILVWQRKRSTVEEQANLEGYDQLLQLQETSFALGRTLSATVAVFTSYIFL